MYDRASYFESAPGRKTRGLFRGNAEEIRRVMDKDEEDVFRDLRAQARVAVVVAVVGLLLLGALAGIGLKWLLVG